MTRIIIFFTLLLSSFNTFSQDYMDKLADQTCKCIQNIPDTLQVEDRNMKLGLCMINEAMPYKKQIKRDHNIDLDKLDRDEGEKLGRVVGIRAAGKCPDVFLKLAGSSNDEEEAAVTEEVSIGKITSIENNGFIVFLLRDKSSKVSKYYWITGIESELDLPLNYKTLVGKNVSITYTITELFDAKIEAYKNFNVISKIELK
jgi:hypothetical protein